MLAHLRKSRLQFPPGMSLLLVTPSPLIVFSSFMLSQMLRQCEGLRPFIFLVGVIGLFFW